MKYRKIGIYFHISDDPFASLAMKSNFPYILISDISGYDLFFKNILFIYFFFFDKRLMICVPIFRLRQLMPTSILFKIKFNINIRYMMYNVARSQQMCSFNIPSMIEMDRMFRLVL